MWEFVPCIDHPAAENLQAIDVRFASLKLFSPGNLAHCILTVDAAAKTSKRPRVHMTCLHKAQKNRH